MFDSLTREERQELWQRLNSAYHKGRRLERFLESYVSLSFYDPALSSMVTEALELTIGLPA